MTQLHSRLLATSYRLQTLCRTTLLLETQIKIMLIYMMAGGTNARYTKHWEKREHYVCMYSEQCITTTHISIGFHVKSASSGNEINRVIDPL